MSFLNKLTGGGVEWQLDLASASGVYNPGDEIVARVRYLARGRSDVRGIHAALVATEHAVFMTRSTHDRGVRIGSGSSRGSKNRTMERRWFTEDLHLQEQEVSGPAAIVDRQQGEFEIRFAVPADGSASFDSPILKLRWMLRVWMDVGGRDPRTEREVYVTLRRDRLETAEAALAPSWKDESGTIWVEPVPLMAGEPFRGAIETDEQLDPGGVRLELKQRVETHGSGSTAAIGIDVGGLDLRLGGGGRQGVSDERVLWSGHLTPAASGQSAGTHRYEFSGVFGAGPIGTISLPHGRASARLDAVISRRLMPDRHISRPVAIITG